MLEWIVNKLLGRDTPATGCTPPSAPSQQRRAVSFGFVAGTTPSPNSGRSQLAAIGNTEAICPYCGTRLDKKPARKKECPNCSKPIYVRTRPLDNQKVLVTEEQKEAVEEQWSIVNGSHAAYLAERCARDWAVGIAHRLTDRSADPTPECRKGPATSEWIANTLLGREVLTTPEQLVPYIVDNFDEAAEHQIAAAQAQVRQVCPQSPEVALLYAFRVSKCVPRVTNFETLASRWRTACFGPRGAAGLFAGRDSVNYRRAYEFLASIYLKRFCELVRATVDKAEHAAANRKSISAKENVYFAAIRKVEDAGRLLDHYDVLRAEGLLWREEAQRWTEHLKQRAAVISSKPQ
jgi:predicted RNA-binding Zn-ribbon protein involved in translation (DUF1610 family)